MTEENNFTPLPSVPEKGDFTASPPWSKEEGGALVDDEAPPPPPPPTTPGGTPHRQHRKNSSSLSDLSMLELDRTGDDGTASLIVHDVTDNAATIPVSSLIVLTDTSQLEKPTPGTPQLDTFNRKRLSSSSIVVDPTISICDSAATEIAIHNNDGGVLLPPPTPPIFQHNILQDMMHDWSDFGDFTLDEGAFRVKDWDGKKGYSDYIHQGIKYKLQQQEKEKQMEEKKDNSASAMDMSTTTNNTKPPVTTITSPDNVVMLFESPSSCTADFTFQNVNKFRFHDWPPPSKTGGKSVLGPCRYALMNGITYPVFLKDGVPPVGLLEHWKNAVPGFVEPSFVDKIVNDTDTVYAYLPVEQIEHHVNDPDIHYHLAGKDAIHLMTQKTTELLSDTKTVRPCVVKTTHSMGSKGIFIIQNDDDEREFERFLEESGHPTYVVTNFVDIARNVACHFFMHPNGSIVWFGSNENHREADGSFSSDSYLIMEHQEKLKELQLPFVEEVVQYCHGLGFFGFCGVDVLFDSKDRGYLVDINPRVTGSCPALMTLKRLSDAYGFTVGLFRRSGKTCFHGDPPELLEQVAAYNAAHDGQSRIVIHSLYQTPGQSITRINIGVYGNNLNECKTVLNSFAKGPPPKPKQAVDTNP